jgi:hypothetical protein
MHRINEVDDAFIVTTSLARKRVRVVQLLCFGLLGILFGFLASFYVQSSCHFISAEVSLGKNEQTFELHYGMWKYSPLDSAFEGNAICVGYDTVYTYDAPLIPRIAGLTAIILGSYSLSVLWMYLFLGLASRFTWNWAVRLGVLAGISQGLTFLFFAGHVCLRNTCSLGPGAMTSILSTIFWFITAFEMYFNNPLPSLESDIPESGNLLTSLGGSDFAVAGKSYFLRMHDMGHGDALPSLNQIQRNNSAPLGEGVLELSSIRSPMNGSYKPPNEIV